MKRGLALVLSMALALSIAVAVGETGASVFEELAGLEWSFCSGVGGWSTELWIAADGSFTGAFHDSEMGETGEDYPYGTLYGCLFSGKMTAVEQVDENTWKIRIDTLTPDEGQVPEVIDDGIRYVTTEPYGVSAGDEMLLYRPGTPVEIFTEDMLFWTHVMEQENPPAALDNWFLCSEKNESGFVGYASTDDMAEP